ncbi:MAG: VIT1/CCC1 transporter family protein [Candidatus Methylarchaceae archaeon HK01M]|nr:VIT1/CCC1 transporter family protein [Candidatus Methylarchaceae archaeon HK01M]
MTQDLIAELAKVALDDEIFASNIYKRLAKLYSGEAIRLKLIMIAEMEIKHAEFWQKFLEKRGFTPSLKPSRWKVALYPVLMRLLGLGLSLGILEKGEINAIEFYSRMLESQELDDYKRRELKKILEDELFHEQEFVQEESRFEEFLSHVKDAVRGMNGGLVQILSVTAGLVGLSSNPFFVALGGLIIGVAGALSMGIGTFASIKAQRQVHEGALYRIRNAAQHVAHVFRDRIAGYMKKKGYSQSVSEALADEAAKEPRLLSRVIAEEEYDIREETLENPLKGGLYTGLSYIFGALVSLLPYFLGLQITIAMVSSLLLAGAALAFTGLIIAISANLPVKRKMLEMIIIGLGSAGATFLVGRAASILIGIEVG